MSSNLTAEPVLRKKLDLGTAIKFALRKRFGEPVNIIMTAKDFQFFEGIIAAGNEECIANTHKLVEYINKHGEVHVKEEY